MELADYLNKCADPAAVAAFISNPGEGISVRFWDNFTLDITASYPAKAQDYLDNFSCPICSTPIAATEKISSTIKGMFLTCPKCKQVYFVHDKLPFGGTADTLSQTF